MIFDILVADVREFAEKHASRERPNRSKATTLEDPNRSGESEGGCSGDEQSEGKKRSKVCITHYTSLIRLLIALVSEECPQEYNVVP